jgi:hypothetical protein
VGHGGTPMLVPALRRLKLEDDKFEACLGYVSEIISKKKRNKKKPLVDIRSCVNFRIILCPEEIDRYIKKLCL